MKQKLSYVLMALLFITSCSVDRMQETVVIEGLDGNSTLVSVTNLPEGSESCPAGGTQLSFGVDTDGDGSLSEDEISSRASVCNGVDGEDGEDGKSFLVDVSPVNASDEYPNGAVEVSTGFDVNGNGILDEDEVSTSEIVENGVDGEDGFSTVISTEIIEENTEIDGVLYEEGGLVIRTGLDTNENGVLDEGDTGEVTVNYIRNGHDGLQMVYDTEYFEESEEYPNGGVEIFYGLDDNQDNILNFDERDGSYVVGNGTDGSSTVVLQEETENGVQITTFLDLNGNGILDEDETSTTTTVLNGQDGQDGTDGEQGIPGNDGLVSLVRTTTIEPNEDYPNGATLIITGLDDDGDGVLDEDEIDNTVYVSNGIDGLDGINGVDGEDGVDGVNGLNSLVELERLESDPLCGETEHFVNYNGNDDKVRITFMNKLMSDGELIGYKFRVRNATDNPITNVEVRKGGQNPVFTSNEIPGNTEVFFLTPNPIAGLSVHWDGGSKGSASTNEHQVKEDVCKSGIIVKTGTDDDGDDVLDEEEVDNEEFVSDGQDGVDGEDCVECCTFTTITVIPPGDDCVAGGKKISIYKDTNGNKVLDENDLLESFAFICNPPECYEVVTRVKNIDFDQSGFVAGDIVSTIYTIGTNGGKVNITGTRSNFNGNQAMIFDSNNPTGQDPDLASGDDNVLIISEDNDSSDPDDNHNGGVLFFDFSEFNSIVSLESIDLIDIEYEDGSNDNNYIEVTEKGSNTVTTIPIVFNGTGGVTTYPLDQFDDVETLTIILTESGAVDNLLLNYNTVVDVCSPFYNQGGTQ